MIIPIEQLRDIYLLKNLVRYNTRRKLTNESVAEHSFYVALISLQVCNKLKLNDDTTSKVMIKALLHDMPEIEINDITHDAKEKLKLRPYLKQYEDDYYDRKFPQYAEMMKQQDDLISTIVDMADAMSVLQYTDNELILGNQDSVMNDIYQDTLKRVEDKEAAIYQMLSEGGNYGKKV